MSHEGTHYVVEIKEGDVVLGRVTIFIEVLRIPQLIPMKELVETMRRAVTNVAGALETVFRMH